MQTPPNLSAPIVAPTGLANTSPITLGSGQTTELAPTCQPASGSNSGRYLLNTGDIGRSFWCRVTRNGRLLTSASGATVERAVSEAVRKVRLARHCGSL